MTSDPKSLRSTLGHVRGLGSAHSGTEHWWVLRLTSLALIPLAVYFGYSFFTNVVLGGYTDSMRWLHTPVSATFLVLFLLTSLHHAASGLQVVIEDYVHCEKAKFFTIIVVKFICAILAVFGVLAIIKVLIGV